MAEQEDELKTNEVEGNYSSLSDVFALTPEQMRGLHNLQRGVGEVCMLMSGHPYYGNMFLGDISRSVIPPVLLNQYRLVRNQKDRTVGFVSWAMVDKAVHQRLMRGVLKLQQKDWQSGDIAVVMDVVAPTPEGGSRMLGAIKQEQFSDKGMWIIDSTAGANAPKLKRYTPPLNADMPPKEKLH